MTIADRNNKLKHYITCLKCEVSGKCCDANCSTQYEAGNMGEIIENLESISKALDRESILDNIRAEIEKQYKWIINTRYTIRDVDIAFDSIFQIIDKYKAESEG